MEKLQQVDLDQDNLVTEMEFRLLLEKMRIQKQSAEQIMTILKFKEKKQSFYSFPELNFCFEERRKIKGLI